MAQTDSSADDNVPSAAPPPKGVSDLGVPIPDNIPEEAPAPVAGSFWSYVKSFGPGIVVALSWVGTGDLVDNSVAGANYGYALLWVLPLTLVLRFLFVSSLGKYPIYNVQRDPSLVRGFARTHPVFGWLMMISFILYTHILLAFTLSGVGVALEGLFGGPSRFVWTLIGAASVLLVTFKGVYRTIEQLFKIILVVMVASFVLAVAMVGISWGELVQGFAFDLPPKSGLFDSSLVASSLVLATLGSMANLFYPQFLREKGWTTPAHRRVQQYDLLFGTFIVLFLGVSIWAVGAEVIHGDGSGIDDPADIANALGTAIGPVGPYLFYLGLLGAAWTTVTGSIFALSLMTVESVHVIKPSRSVAFDDEPRKDPIYKVMIAWGLLAVVWSIPGAPGFIVLVVVAHVLTSPFLLVIAIGMIFMMNKKAIMGEHVNNWKENLALALITVFVAVAAYQGLIQAYRDVAG
ncbi:MAG: Nramp family divalent metal transporter [Nocardioidaceae bacterium]